MGFSVNAIGKGQGVSASHGQSGGQAYSRPIEYTVKQKDTLTKIAKNYGMTVDEFCKWTGVKKNKTLSVGENIKLPKQVAVPAGKGILAVARANNMDLDRFCSLNGISKNYSAKAGETFYVCKGLKNFEAGRASCSGRVSGGGSATGTDNGFSVVQLPKEGYWTVKAGEEYSVRVLSGKPRAVKSGGQVVSETIKFEPYKNNTGELKGKVIMVNAGHGMKQQSSAQLDMGKPDAKDENGKQIEEWRKNRDYAEELIKDLRAKGATVIFTNGDAKNACAVKKKFKCDLFVSLHCNATANRSKHGLEVFYHQDATKGKELAENTAAKLNGTIHSDIETRHGVLGVLTNIGPKACPSILIECGYLTNANDMRNIDSIADRKKKMDALTEVIVDYKNNF